MTSIELAGALSTLLLPTACLDSLQLSSLACTVQASSAYPRVFPWFHYMRVISAAWQTSVQLLGHHQQYYMEPQW